MRRIALVLAANALLAILLLREGGGGKEETGPAALAVEKICLPDGAELERRGESWWLVKPFAWPAAALPPEWLVPSHGSPLFRPEEGRWQDLLERRLVWHGPGPLDRIQLWREDGLALLERRNGGWQLLPRGDLDGERLQRWLESLRTLEVGEPVEEVPGNAVAVLLLEGPLAAQRQRIEFFRGEEGRGRVRVNGGALFSLAGGDWESVLREMDSLRSRRLFPAAGRSRLVWEDRDGVVLWQRDGERWVRIPSNGAVEEVSAAAAGEFFQKLDRLEWENGQRSGECAGEAALSVDGHRLQLGPAGEDGRCMAWDGERCLTLDAEEVDGLRRLLRGEGSAAPLPADEEGQGQQSGGAEK
ncbi:MAG: hypothetical protein LBT98_03670 [Puniceicoccales bacterium]|jgi:hypothetical protein|nr:hypothetical protein [Puniceicoccales bacterium]